MGEKKERSTKLKFFDFAREELQKRWELAESGVVPQMSDKNNFYYRMRLAFLKLHPELTEVCSEKERSYVRQEFGDRVINGFCKDKAEKQGMDRETEWWYIRDKLNIFAKGRAICEGTAGKFLIDKDTRDRVTKGCSLILICEKATVSAELLAALRDEGYRINLISAGGKDTADTKEAIRRATKELSQENFFILYLHDYDISGIEMYYTIKNIYPHAIDIGISQDFLRRLGDIDTRLVEERVLNKCYARELESVIDHKNYDFGYLQGSEFIDNKHVTYTTSSGKIRKAWSARRIEIDSIHAEYGIKPFVDYIEIRLADIKCWDLTRLGIEEKELDEPENRYERYLFNRKHEIRKEYQNKTTELSKNYNVILGIVNKSITLEPEMSKLNSKYWTIDRDFQYWRRELKSDELDDLKQKYKNSIEKEWVEDYEEELDKEINDKLECWDGDVTFVSITIDNKFDEIQEKLNDAKRDDPLLGDFMDDFSEIDFGLEKLKEIQPADPAHEVRKVINALYEYLGELEGDEE